MDYETADTKKVSISGVDIDTEVVDMTANAWITVEVANHTKEEQRVAATVVVAQGENREDVEIVEDITPFGGVIEAVIRIEDPTMWQPDDSGQRPQFDCMVGLEIGDEVMDAKTVKFDVE